MNDGGPAFPQSAAWKDGICTSRESGPLDSGMSLRDWFAGMALQGILSAMSRIRRPVDIPLMAQYCYGIADAMIAERERTT